MMTKYLELVGPPSSCLARKSALVEEREDYGMARITGMMALNPAGVQVLYCMIFGEQVGSRTMPR